MLSGKNQAGTTPTALGSMLQASTYGATIPTIYGMTLSPLYVIWAANLRQGGSTKKFKQLKKGITAYVENIDFLLGHNPIWGVQQMWNNGSPIPLTFIKRSVAAAVGQIFVPSATTSPDPNFYAVIGVTLTQPYSVTFDDYGGGGPVTLTGTYEIPLWNELAAGPDPTANSGYRNYPFCYRWEPSMGASFFIDAADFDLFGFTGHLFVYYTQLMEATSFTPPIQKMRLTFENELGNGTEYSDAGLSAQQVIYPMFAGLGSSDIDLGSSGAIPQLQAEVQGKFGLYGTGDADFADMIEDVFKSGVAQAAIGATSGGGGFTAVEHGLSSYHYPGCIQFKMDTSVEMSRNHAQTYNLPVTEGNFLVVIGVTTGSGTGALSISDTGSNTWTGIFTSSHATQAWYAQANASGTLSVTMSGLGFDWVTTIIEIGGVDTFDSVTLGTNGNDSITTTNILGQPGYVLSLGLYIPGHPPNPEIPLWNNVSGINTYGNGPACNVYDRIVNAPGTYSISLPTNSGTLEFQALLAFKSANPPTYPSPVGDFIDHPSLDLVRLQCRANGLYGSLSMNSQQEASDWLKSLYQAADAAPVYVGFSLFSMPYSEVSAVGNGVTYNAPTAAGPSFKLSSENGDFVSKIPITMKSSARVDQPNVLQMQCVNRTSNYNPSVVEQPDAVGISFFGIRKADPIVNNAVQDVSIARQLLGIAVRNLQYASDVYTFSLSARWSLLAPMGAGGGGYADAVLTISDPLADMNNIPVRLSSITEQPDGSLECEAIPFVYGMNNPAATDSTTGTNTPTPYTPNLQAQSGAEINPPIIFEATPRLAAQTSPSQIWIATSCGVTPSYGGCQCYISTDGGTSYTPASSSPAFGSAMQAEVDQGEWPAASDPDTTNNLFLSFALTLPDPPGTLSSYSATQRDNFQYPCYVGFSNLATVEANYTAGDTAQITQLGALFSAPTILNALPSDAVIVNIFPMVVLETDAPGGSPVVTQVFSGTGMTPISGGTNDFGPVTGAFPPTAVPSGGGPGIGTSLSGQEIRYNLALGTTGAAACSGILKAVGWAILYNSATPTIDPLTIEPFAPSSGQGWGWAVPNTVATGMVGSGTNATVAAFGGVPPAGIPYEIMTYNQATMLGAGLYELMATGSGNELRRGVFAAPSPGVGMNHPPGSPFALLDPSNAGLFQIDMDPAWVGTQLWFKFPTFDTFGSQLSGLDNVTAYPYTPTGIPGNIGPATGGILVNGV